MDWLHNSLILVIACGVSAWIEDLRNSISGARPKQLPRGSARVAGVGIEQKQRGPATPRPRKTFGAPRPWPALETLWGGVGRGREQPITGFLSGDVRARSPIRCSGRTCRGMRGWDRATSHRPIAEAEGVGLRPACAPTAFWCCLRLVPSGPSSGGGAGGNRGRASGESRTSAGVSGMGAGGRLGETILPAS